MPCHKDDKAPDPVGLLQAMEGGTNDDNCPTHWTSLSTQQFGNLNYDIAEDLEYPPAPAEASSNVSSHLYTSAVNFYEEFDFNNLNQPLPGSDENTFEFVDFDDLLPTGD
ncbi:hypothetical protein LTS15_002628 [Exophiala xenobiotica]|nr:hypothetical protein LTS15_002628 [Exophiala xenobiotica]